MVTEELTKALRLALAGQRDHALAILAKLAVSAPDDFRVWWALANISQSPAEVRAALLRVLQLKADHTEAYEMLDELDQPKPSPRKVRHAPATASV